MSTAPKMNIDSDAVDDDADNKRKKEKTVATKLVELATDSAGLELFHTPGDGEPYATVEVGGHFETYKLHGKQFRRYLSGLYWHRYKKPIGSQSMQDSLNVLAAIAIFQGREHLVAVRIAEHGGRYYLDLGGADWHVLEIAPDGWREIADAPVKFIRPRGVLALPRPIAGGDVAELRQFVNVASDADWALLTAWLVSCFRPSGPYPILALYGEQGSAKSTTLRVLRSLIDPNKAALRSEPRDERDLVIAASNAWVLGLDNLSRISPSLSDGLCRIATGGGFATRELYSDDDEIIFDSMRPIMLDAIEEVVGRPDLLDRAIVLTLPTIPEASRITERELWQRFEQARPRILGALLTAVSVGMRNLPGVKMDCPPRMADFAEWAVACESALGLDHGTFLAAYTDNRKSASQAGLEASHVAIPVLKLVGASKNNRWEGTVGELLKAIEADGYSDEQTRRRRGWPKTARGLSGGLRRIAPNLRTAGVSVTFGEHSRKGVSVVLEQVGDRTVTTVTPSQDPLGATENADFDDSSVTVGDGCDGRVTVDDSIPSHPEPHFWPENGDGDGCDGCDGLLQDYSKSDEEVSTWMG